MSVMGETEREKLKSARESDKADQPIFVFNGNPYG